MLDFCIKLVDEKCSADENFRNPVLYNVSMSFSCQLKPAENYTSRPYSIGELFLLICFLVLYMSITELTILFFIQILLILPPTMSDRVYETYCKNASQIAELVRTRFLHRNCYSFIRLLLLLWGGSGVAAAGCPGSRGLCACGAGGSRRRPILRPVVGPA